MFQRNSRRKAKMMNSKVWMYGNGEDFSREFGVDGLESKGNIGWRKTLGCG